MPSNGFLGGARCLQDQDICTYCHGGNGSSLDKALAYEGLMAQLLRIFTPVATAVTLQIMWLSQLSLLQY